MTFENDAATKNENSTFSIKIRESQYDSIEIKKLPGLFTAKIKNAPVFSKENTVAELREYYKCPIYNYKIIVDEKKQVVDALSLTFDIEKLKCSDFHLQYVFKYNLIHLLLGIKTGCNSFTLNALAHYSSIVNCHKGIYLGNWMVFDQDLLNIKESKGIKFNVKSIFDFVFSATEEQFIYVQIRGIIVNVYNTTNIIIPKFVDLAICIAFYMTQYIPKCTEIRLNIFFGEENSFYKHESGDLVLYHLLGSDNFFPKFSPGELRRFSVRKLFDLENYDNAKPREIFSESINVRLSGFADNLDEYTSVLSDIQKSQHVDGFAALQNSLLFDKQFHDGILAVVLISVSDSADD